MSDFVTANPYAPGSLEDQQQLAGQLAALKLAPPALGRGVLSNLLVPAPDSGVQGVPAYLPGAVTAPISVLDSVIKAGNTRFPALQQLDNSLGIGKGIAGGEAAHEAYLASLQRADDWSTAVGLPPPGPETPEAQKFNSVMEGVGSSLGFPVSGIPSMPVRAAIKTLIPGSVAPVASPITAGVLSAGTDMLQHSPPGATRPEEKTPPGVDPLIAPQPPTVGGVDELPGPLGSPPAPVGPMPPPAPRGEHDTAWTIGEAAFGAGAIVAGLGYGLRVRGALRTGTSLQRQMRASEPFNLAESARKSGTAPITPTEPMPEAPIPGRTTGVVLKEAVADKDEGLKSYMEAIQPNETAAEKARAKAGMLLSDEAFHSRVSTFAETGHDAQSGITVPSPQDHFIRVGQFSPGQTTAFKDARMAADEIDNRVRVYNQLKVGGGAIPDEATRVWFKDKDSAELRKLVSDARLDPAVARELDEINAIHRGMVEIAGAHGYFSNAEVANLKTTHPNYLPIADVDGRIKSPFIARNIEAGAGNDVMSISPSEADKQHVVAFMKELNDNNFRVQFYQDSIAYQNRNSTMGPSGLREGPAEIVEVVRNHNGHPVMNAPDDGSTFPVRVNGELLHVRVKNPTLLALVKQGPKPLGAFMDAMSAVRQMNQSFTTGVGALAGGRFFPPVNAFRDAMLGSVTRPQGTGYGLLDAAVNKASGGKFGLPGDFATALPLQAYGMVADTASVVAGRVGKMLTPGFNNPVNNFLRWTLGDPITDAMQKRIQAQYYKSVLFDARQRGILRSAGYGSEETPVFQIGAAKGSASSTSPLNNLAPGLFRANDPRIPFTNIRVPIGGALVPFVRFNELVHDLFNVINDSAKMHFLRMSEGKYPLMKWTDLGKDREVVSAATREIAGDMAAKGRNVGIRSATAAIPYLNPMFQGMANVGKAINKRPLATFFGAVHAVGMLAMAATYLAVLHGQDAIDHQQDKLSASEQARSAWMYHPDSPPEAALQLPLPQEFQGLFAVMLQATRDAWGVGSHFLSPEGREWSLRGLTELLGKYITYDTANTALAGADAMLQVNAPPAVNAATGIAFNKQFVFSPRNVVNSVTTNSQPITGAFTAPVGGGSPLAPDRPDPTSSDVGGKVVQGLAKSLFAIGADTAIQMWHSGKMEWNSGGSARDTMSAAIDAWSQNFRDKNPMFNNMLWVNEAKMSRTTQLVERTNHKLMSLDQTKGASADMNQAGLTRSGGEVLPDADVAPHKMPTDPVMRELWVYGSQQNSRIRNSTLKYANDTKKQMEVIGDVPGQPQDVVRYQYNLLNAQYQRRMGRVADELRDVEHHMSQMLGGGHVVLEHIDWSKGPDQFVR